VTDARLPDSTPPSEHDNSGWIILGAVLIVAGFFLGANNLGLVPWPLGDAWRWMMKARTGIGVLLVGVLLIVWAQSGRSLSMPRRGGKLMRSRSEKWLAGVLGGLAQYLGTDVTILRLGFIALVVLFDIGGLVFAYIIMAILMPLEPVAGLPVPEPAPPAAPEPPAPPTA